MGIPGLARDTPVFVAGHGGLLGSAIVRLLTRQGFTRILVRSHRQLDLADPRATRSFFRRERPQVVFLCAGATGGIQANLDRPAELLHCNLAIQDAVFEAAHDTGTAHLVFYGSSCIYPRDAPQPILESALFGGPIETSSAPYASAKTAGIMACQAYNRQYDRTRFLALVPNSMFGPGDNFDPDSGHVLASLVRRMAQARSDGAPEVTLWGSGDPVREFIHSDDVARASLFAVTNADRMENRHYNVGTGQEVTIRDLAELIRERTGYRGRILWDRARPDGTPRKVLDSTSFRNLGWTPEVPLAMGIAETCAWFRSSCRQGS